MSESHTNLHFPSKLILKVLELGTNQAVSNIAVILTLHARQKNNYHLRPDLSNLDGEIEVDKAWVEKSINEIKNFFLMDYQSSLEECYHYIDVSTVQPSNIASAISAMKIHGIETGGLGIAHTAADLMRSDNHLYVFKEIRIELRSPDESVRRIEVRLQRSGLNKK